MARRDEVEVLRRRGVEFLEVAEKALADKKVGVFHAGASRSALPQVRSPQARRRIWQDS
ncbi:MAG: hypothetical protein QXN23_01370 [Candidatus Caldarchaeum sp.]